MIHILWPVYLIVSLVTIFHSQIKIFEVDVTVWKNHALADLKIVFFYYFKVHSSVTKQVPRL